MSRLKTLLLSGGLSVSLLMVWHFTLAPTISKPTNPAISVTNADAIFTYSHTTQATPWPVARDRFYLQWVEAIHWVLPAALPISPTLAARIRFQSVEANAYHTLRLPRGLLYTDNTPPEIISPTLQRYSTSTAKLTWLTNEPATSCVYYGPIATTSDTIILPPYYTHIVSHTDFTRYHEFSLSDLNAGRPYTYLLQSTDLLGNVSGQTYAGDRVPPIISSITLTSLSTNTAWLTWKTNEPTQDDVLVWTDRNYTFYTRHYTQSKQLWLDLQAGNRYSYRLKSLDLSGNFTVTSHYSFTTPTDIVVMRLAAESKGESVTLTWQTLREEGLWYFYFWRKNAGDWLHLRVTSPIVIDTIHYYTLVDAAITSGNDYTYYLNARRYDGDNDEYGHITVHIDSHVWLPIVLKSP